MSKNVSKVRKEVAKGYILTAVKDGVRIIKFNRPEKRNAICREMYVEITNILTEDAVNNNVVVTILTGCGEFYSSGNDFTIESTDQNQNFSDEIDGTLKVVEKFFGAFINYPKLLIAVVNGPAVGAGVTSLGLCDIVYASDRATFSTPFVALGLAPEGCSSYLFPHILGRSKASELLILGHKMNAQEAFQFGLVSEVIPHTELGLLFEKLQNYGGLSITSVTKAKELINVNYKNVLHEVNKRECNSLQECFNSEEFFNGLLKFAGRKQKL